MENNQGTRRGRFSFGEAAIDAGSCFGERNVIGSVVDEGPAEDLRIKLLGPLDVGGVEFYVLDVVVALSTAHGISPVRGGRGVAGAWEEKVYADSWRRHTIPSVLLIAPPSTFPQKRESAGRAHWFGSS